MEKRAADVRAHIEVGECNDVQMIFAREIDYTVIIETSKPIK